MFYAAKWVAEIITSSSSYNAIEILLTHKATIEFHVNKFRIMTLSVNEAPVDATEDTSYTYDELDNFHLMFDGINFDSGAYDEILDKRKDMLIKKMAIDLIREGNATYQKQMMILIASYVEAVILDFLKSIIAKHPLRAYDYIHDDEKTPKGKIDLREILDANTKDVFIDSLAIKASHIAARGKFKTTLSNLEKISKHKLDPQLSEDLSSIVERRNRLVHELANIDVSDKDVIDGFDCLRNFISSLVLIAQENDVDVDNSEVI